MKFNSKTLKNMAPALGAVAVASAAGASNAMAVPIDLTGITVDLADYQAIAKVLIVALVSFWGIKKGMSLFGR